MPEIKKKVRTYEVNYLCDECEKGKMIFTGDKFEVRSLILYEHKCDNCEFIDNMPTKYPTVIYEIG